jgi:hypothetical protein
MHIKLKDSTLSAAFGLMLAAGAGLAQSPSPSPSGPDTGNYTITSSMEVGVRGLSVNGDHEKYRSDLNYRAGVRMFDSSFLIEDNTKGYKLFDTALIQSSGWGADPQGSFRFNMDKAGIFKFDSNVRRVRYFNNLKTHSVNWSQAVPTGSQHALNTLHHFGDFDLTIFPERDFRIRVGYSFNNTNGPGFNNLRFPISSSDEFQVNSSVKNRSQDIRLGLEGEVFGFNWGINYGRRNFRDRTRLFLNQTSIGNNPATNTAVLTSANRQYGTAGTTDFVHGFLQRTFAKRVDLTARLIYSESNSNIQEADDLTGRASPTGNIIYFDRIFVPGKVRRPQTRGDLGLTFRITDSFRVSNTFTFDQFSIGGSNSFSELLRATTASGGTVADQVTDQLFWRSTGYRKFSNLIEADYQVNRRFAFNIGYRYTRRDVALDALDINRISRVVTADGESEENTTHTVIAGGKFKPKKNWSIFVDLERGESDNVFTRLANNDFFNFRIRSVASVKRFTLNLSAITKDSDNPGTSEPLTNAGGFPATETVANSKIRIFSGSIDWTPRTDLSFSAGHTYHHQTTRADIIVPLGTPLFTSTRWLLGSSEYYVRNGYFFFDVSAQPVKWVSLYAAYRIDDDRGQGDRVMARPQDFITSYPMRYQTPEVRLAFRITNNVDWSVGYQYYSYRETPYFNPFSAVTYPTYLFSQRFPAQNYSAHMPYTSLKIYFGRAAADR